jgi:hypothetical protein
VFVASSNCFSCNTVAMVLQAAADAISSFVTYALSHDVVLCLWCLLLQVVRDDGSLGLSKVFAMPHYQHTGANLAPQTGIAIYICKVPQINRTTSMTCRLERTCRSLLRQGPVCVLRRRAHPPSGRLRLSAATAAQTCLTPPDASASGILYTSEMCTSSFPDVVVNAYTLTVPARIL